MKTFRPIALGLVAAFAFPAHALTFADGFTIGATSVSNDAANGMKWGSGVDLGGGVSRVLGTEILTNGASGDSRARSAIGGGHYSFSTDAEVWGDGRLGYAFSPGDMGADAEFKLDFLSNDRAGMGGVSLTDALGRSALLMFALPSQTTAFSLVTPSFATAGLDLSHIVKADFMMNPGQGGDLMIDGIRTVQTVPEPTSLAALSAGALALLRRRRK